MACHNQRWWPFLLTKLHISSISASPARVISTATSSGFSVRSRAVFTDSNVFLLLEITQHGVRTDPQHARCIVNPTGVETHVNDRVLHLGQTPAVAIVEKKTAIGTRRVLAQVALCAAARFAAFDDLLTVTMRASDHDECHWPPFPAGRCQDEAQCDINLGPSPLLEHYQ
jgi:hypothetical protein